MKGKIELMAPAGAVSSLYAAACAGADSVYFGLEGFSARAQAKNFSKEELKEAAPFCRELGIKMFAALNILVFGREEEEFLKEAEFALESGADGLIVQDIGMIKALRASFPESFLIGSTQMAVHSLDGVKECARLGLNRVVLARELPLSDIEYITKNSPIEVEVFIHGALCMAYSGQCYFSGQIGGRSGNRGRCAQVCRLPYKWEGKEGYPLSLKDFCGAAYVNALSEMGVKSLKIEGRMKRPEYVAIVTDVYRKIIDTASGPSKRDLRRLRTIFSRDGFTDSYLSENKGRHMFGIHSDGERDEEYQAILKEAKGIMNPKDERKRLAAFQRFEIRENEQASLYMLDEDGFEASVLGEVPGRAEGEALTFLRAQASFGKLGGTPYYIKAAEGDVGEGLYLSTASLNEMRRQAVSELKEKRLKIWPLKKEELQAPPRHLIRAGMPLFTASVRSWEQADAIFPYKPVRVYMPMFELLNDLEKLRKMIKRDYNIYAAVPSVFFEKEKEAVMNGLSKLKDAGVSGVMAANIAHIRELSLEGFKVHCNFQQNIVNERAVLAIRDMGADSFTASIEMRLSQIRDLKKYIDCEAIVYGKSTLMLTENCLKSCGKRAAGCEESFVLEDRKRERFAVLPTFGCRNEVLNAHPLHLCDKLSDFENIDLSYLRLDFTDEEPKEVARIFSGYEHYSLPKPKSFTRGLYYKGVE